jgi:hypothetical protein
VSSSSSGSSSTSGISRDHVIFSEPDGLVTVTGAHLGLGFWSCFSVDDANLERTQIVACGVDRHL